MCVFAFSTRKRAACCKDNIYSLNDSLDGYSVQHERFAPGKIKETQNILEVSLSLRPGRIVEQMHFVKLKNLTLFMCN